jgi:hypothetical protein
MKPGISELDISRVATTAHDYANAPGQQKVA